MEDNEKKIESRVAKNTLVGNILLSAFKLFAGFFAHSAAMISDAIHSLSDVVADIIVLVGVRLAGRKSDKHHPYGHDRIECVAGILLAYILFAVGCFIGYGGIKRIIAAIGGHAETLVIPGALALVAAVVSIVVKEGMFWYTRAAWKKTGSVALKASAWHHRSDAMSSVGSLIGIAGSRMGYPVLDSVACVIICVFIIKVAVDVFKESIDKMIDTAAGDEVENKIREIALAQENVLGIDLLDTRLFGDKMYVDLEIAVNGDFSLRSAHNVAESVHAAIEQGLPNVKHCMVHVNPR